MAVSEPLGEWDPGPPQGGGLFCFGGSIQPSSGLLHGEERGPPRSPWGAANVVVGPFFFACYGEWKLGREEKRHFAVFEGMPGSVYL